MDPLIAVLDANVLIPAAPRDTLLRAAELGLFQPVWSDQILDEVQRNLVSAAHLDDLHHVTLSRFSGQHSPTH